MTPIEAKFEIDRQLVALAAKNNGKAPLVRGLRFFLYPGSYHEVLVCAELVDGDELQASFELPVPVAGSLNEDAVREMFLDTPSGARH